MSTFRYLTRISIGLGTVSSFCAYYTFNKSSNLKAHSVSENNGFNDTWSKWDYDWDKRNCVKKEVNTVDDKNIVKPTAIRHIILIRHGQYDLAGTNDNERMLTILGREQAELAGKRLKELDNPYSSLIHSTMTRAAQTAEIIHDHIPEVPMTECIMLEEGAPIQPEPPVGHWKPAHYQFHQDGARIEAAFRKYFYRAYPEQEKDSFSIIVCHANVIRYFVCRALQYPPEGWLRLSLKHASITWVSILPSGRVLLRSFGDAGYMHPRALTTT